VKRFPFLDWLRGLAVIIMIQCHAFNSFTRMDLRQSGGFVWSQFIGGMAAPLFLFMAGMTFGFQMESLDRRELRAIGRWWISLRRAGYILVIALLFRLTNWIGALPNASLEDLLKVDILNCMGVALAAFAAMAAVQPGNRVRYTVVAALAVAALAPVMSGLDWSSAPSLLRDYVVPSPLRGRFPFFPCAAYVGFGLATGTVVKRASAGNLDRLMQWAVLIGFVLIFGGLYFSNLPFSLYEHSDFWRNSPGLILIRVGIALLLLSAAYLWTEYCTARGWSWIENFGKTSLLVYWVHVALVYGSVTNGLRRGLTIPQAALATVAVTLLMVGLAELRLRWVAQNGQNWKARRTPAGAPA
jgi:uncharacterized membrane protein